MKLLYRLGTVFELVLIRECYGVIIKLMNYQTLLDTSQMAST